jgi:hypothetical protein
MGVQLKPDGCTNAPDLFWKACCDKHDQDYSDGIKSRAECDAEFLRCMRRNGKTFIGRNVLSFVYWCAVRCFGGSHYGNNVPNNSEPAGINRAIDLRGEGGTTPNASRNASGGENAEGR